MHTSYNDPIEFEDDVLVPNGARPSTEAWRAILRGIYGSPMSESEREIFVRLTNGIEPRPGGWKRVMIIGGRRGGKSETAARILYYEATRVAHYQYLADGQVGVAAIVGQDRARAAEVLNFARGYATHPKIGAYNPRAKTRIQRGKEIANVAVESITTREGIRLEILTGDEGGVRGPTVISAIVDEVAAAWDQSKDADAKTMAALTPGLIVEGDAPTRRCIAISSAGYRRGWAWKVFTDCYGVPDAPWLIIKATTRDLRPTITDAEIDEECAGDPIKRAREFESEWGDTSSSAYFSPFEIKECLAPKPHVYDESIRYHIAIDPSFVHDRFGLAVACSTRELVGQITPTKQTRQRKTRIVRVAAWTPTPTKPLSPLEMAARVSEISMQYGTRTVYSDQHAAIPMAEALKSCGIKLVKRIWHSGHGDDGKNQRFASVREAMLSRTLEIVNDAELIAELEQIVETPLPSGAIRIEGSGKFDDMAHAAIMAASEAIAATPSTRRGSLTPWEEAERQYQELSMGMVLGHGFGPF